MSLGNYQWSVLYLVSALCCFQWIAKMMHFNKDIKRKTKKNSLSAFKTVIILAKYAIMELQWGNTEAPAIFCQNSDCLDQTD